jgi:hypothetical protein
MNKMTTASPTGRPGNNRAPSQIDAEAFDGYLAIMSDELICWLRSETGRRAAVSMFTSR